MNWRYILEHHGFGAFIALLFIFAMLGILPTPFFMQLMAHMNRDQQRDAVMFAVCLNLAGNDAQAKNRCWDALSGVGEVTKAVKEAEKVRR